MSSEKIDLTNPHEIDRNIALNLLADTNRQVGRTLALWPPGLPIATFMADGLCNATEEQVRLAVNIFTESGPTEAGRLAAFLACEPGVDVAAALANVRPDTSGVEPWLAKVFIDQELATAPQPLEQPADLPDPLDLAA